MRDQEDRAVLAPEAAQCGEQAVAGVDVERRGRLVEDQEPPRPEQRARNRDALALGERQAAERDLAGDAVEAERIERLAHHRTLLSDGVAAAEQRIETEHDIVAHGELLQHQRLLEDGGDAGALGLARGAEACRGAVPGQLAAVGGRMPQRILISVLLPEPFSPTRAWISPAGHRRTVGQRHRLAKGAAQPRARDLGTGHARRAPGGVSEVIGDGGHICIRTCGSRP